MAQASQRFDFSSYFYVPPLNYRLSWRTALLSSGFVFPTSRTEQKVPFTLDMPEDLFYYPKQRSRITVHKPIKPGDPEFKDVATLRKHCFDTVMVSLRKFLPWTASCSDSLLPCEYPRACCIVVSLYRCIVPRLLAVSRPFACCIVPTWCLR